MPQSTFRFALHHRSRSVAWLWTITICAPIIAAEPFTRFDFNGPETVWQMSGENRVGCVLLHECARGGARDDAGVERMIVAAPGGESLQLVCPTAPVVVMDELELRVWVKANRPDIQLGARVVLPRTGRNGPSSAARVIVRGDRYERTGQWQQLVLHDVPKRLAAQVRIQRLTTDAEIDSREAFVESVALIVPGEPRGVELATDELVVDGVVRPVGNDVQLVSNPAAGGRAMGAAMSARAAPVNLRRLPENTSSAISATASDETSTVQLRGDLLRVNDKPFLPRAIEYRGEPLQFLVERGFNVAWLDRSPTAAESTAAKKSGLWFIGTPPRPESLVREGVGRADDRVIAWLLDDVAMASDANYLGRWAELVRERDAVVGRPVIALPAGDWSPASRIADILMAACPRSGFVASAEYEGWLARRMSLVRPGAPVWTRIPSQFGSAVARQISLLSSGPAGPPPNISSPQLQSLADIACRHGVRGFAFQSETPLSEPDGATRVRAVHLDLVNRRLQRIEPWLASGKVFGRFPSADAAWTGVVLSVDEARLMIPIANRVMSASRSANRGAEAAFVVPGVPDSCQVYLLTPVALKALPTQRIAGGTRFAMRPDDDTFVLMTEDPKVVRGLRDHIARNGERMVRLLRESAALNAAVISETASRLKQNGVDASAAAQAAASAAPLLRQVDAALASRHVEQAYGGAVAANEKLDQAAGEMRRGAGGQSGLHSNPLALGDDGLAEFVAFVRARSRFQLGDNLLYGGDFENVGQLTQMGWRHFQNQTTGVETLTELSLTDPQHGRYCLALKSAGAAASPPAADVTRAWIESPPMAVTEGQILEISGWVHVEMDNAANGGGLEIIDSLGGADLALAIRQTNGWERFHIIRAVAEESELRIMFTVSGIVTARVDAVMVRPLVPDRQGASAPP